MSANATLAEVKKQARTVRARVLVVDDEPDLVELVDEMVSGRMECRVLSAGSMAEARRILADEPIELLVTDVRLPDGDGISLLGDLQRRQPAARAIVMTGAPSVEGAISALRGGAVDFVPKPFSADQLLERIQSALKRQARAARMEKRLGRLRDAVRRLNESRKVVSRKVDLLCNDLVGAYGDLARQFDLVRTEQGFRAAVEKAKDLEQLLCHAMDWMIRQVGYTNLALWLAGENEEYHLGAYMKYTVASEDALTEAMKQGLVVRTARLGVMHLEGEQVQHQLTPEELDYLADQTVLSANCAYLGESLGVVTLFRGAEMPFREEDVAVMQAVAPLFAQALAHLVRGGREDREEQRDEDDWWKRGERAPF